MLRCARSPRYASAEPVLSQPKDRFVGRLASEIFLSNPQSGFLSKPPVGWLTPFSRYDNFSANFLMSRRGFLILVMMTTALLARAAQSWACAVCLGGSSDSVTDGYNASVLFLMATPYLVVASIAGGLIFTYRRALKRSEKAEEEALALTWKQEDNDR